MNQPLFPLGARPTMAALEGVLTEAIQQVLSVETRIAERDIRILAEGIADRFWCLAVEGRGSKQVTPAHDFGVMIVLSCLQIRAWNAARLQGSRLSPVPHVTLMSDAVAEALLDQAETLGVDTPTLWREFEEALQEGRAG